MTVAKVVFQTSLLESLDSVPRRWPVEPLHVNVYWKLIHLSAVLSFIRLLHYTVSCITGKKCCYELSTIVFSHICAFHTQCWDYFLHIPIPSSQYNFIPPFPHTKCISKNDGKKNLLLWKTLLRKFILFVFRPALPIYQTILLSYVHWCVHLFESPLYGDSNITFWLWTIRRKHEALKFAAFITNSYP